MTLPFQRRFDIPEETCPACGFRADTIQIGLLHVGKTPAELPIGTEIFCGSCDAALELVEDGLRVKLSMEEG